MERYSQLARFQNARHDYCFFVEIAFFDVISNLKGEQKYLLCRSLPCTGKVVVQSYTGAYTADKRAGFLVQTATVVIRLPNIGINTI